MGFCVMGYAYYWYLYYCRFLYLLNGDKLTIKMMKIVKNMGRKRHLVQDSRLCLEKVEKKGAFPIYKFKLTLFIKFSLHV